MFSAFQTFGKLGALASSVARAWSPLSLWPDGIATPGMWISPRTLTSQWADYTGTTPIATPGTVADSSNPVGLALDIRAGATVLTDPGLHMLQSTSPARPLLSARVNLLTYSEDFSNAAWVKYRSSTTVNAATAPNGTTTADKIISAAGLAPVFVYSNSSVGVIGAIYSGSVSVKAAELGFAFICLNSRASSTTTGFCINLTTGAVTNAGIYGTCDVTSEGDGWWRVDISNVVATTVAQYLEVSPLAVAGSYGSYTGDGTSGVYVWGAQVNLGSTALPYQRIGAASDYDASAGPTYTKLDGVDDSWSSATFPAGTLASSMDCLMAVRRDSAAYMACGLAHNWPTSYFGYAGPWHIVDGCGSPAVLVNGLAVPALGGYTGIDLKAVLTPGTWHIIEFRGLNLSAWTSLKADADPGVRLNGALGGIQLFASGQDANRDKARAAMAAYFGVTLP